MPEGRLCPSVRRFTIDGTDQCVEQWAALLDAIPFYVLLVGGQVIQTR